MSGHSKWHQIRHKKAVTDSRRGRVFTQIIKEITIAAKMGGGDQYGNPRLRLAIEKAKASNMPADNIKRAIMKGTGELPGIAYEEVTYEAYGPGGAALFIECVTDNKTRTVSELRHILDRYHGKLASTGAVAYQFHKKGAIAVPKSTAPEEDLMSAALEAGADDIRSDDKFFTVLTPPDQFVEIRKTIETKGFKIEHAELHMMADNTIRVEGKEAEQLLKLMGFLEDQEDVQQVHSNFEIDDKLIAAFEGG